MAQQTAVEWLIEKQINYISENDYTSYKSLVFALEEIAKQAKHREMMQIVQAYHRGLFGNMELEKSTVFGDEYYKETYNK
jgi:molybdopterin synthase catalytic subunit